MDFHFKDDKNTTKREELMFAKIDKIFTLNFMT